ncbi:antirestriction protein ArdA [Endozoicomonas sp. SESOKO1]|uniref:antirestriction protein ArdA n=1 Tax=Endozoicomonas sp. SESOKO1 TaxID=2828742 RepID=UPI0021495CA4|nr:antirestriction protein ArdA [Endozoicomonas sp. SESOKO1]
MTTTTVLCAVPYGYDLPCFYFSDMETYEEKLAEMKELDLKQNLCGDYEHELQFIDGEHGSQSLLDSCEDLDQFFSIVERMESMDTNELAALDWLIDCRGYDLNDALEKYEEVYAVEERPEDYVYEYLDEIGYLSEMPEHLQSYFNYEAFCRDLILGGDWDAHEYEGSTYTITNACCL